MTVRLHIDIETFSATDLMKSGVYRYVEDPEFRILMAWWTRDDDPLGVLRVALTEDEINAIPGLWDPEVLKVAHNATFERICFSEFARRQDAGAERHQFLPPEEWHDTMAIAAERGYPRRLDDLARWIGLEQKDSAGTRLINLFSKPNRAGGRNDEHSHPKEWADFVAYGRQDVVVLRDVDEFLGDWPTEAERQVYLADQRINDRGLRIDTELVPAAIEAMEDASWRNELRISELTGLQNPSSVPQFSRWCREQGLKMPNMRSETIDDALLRDDLTPLQREVLTLRQETALASVKKFPAAWASVSSDGRLRGRFQFYGAHTGRWAGRGAQPQNLPREAFDNDADTEMAIAECIAGEEMSTLDLKRLVRAMFVGPFTVVDYAAIEARVVAWLAGEDWALEAFRKRRDIYVETAERMSTPGNKLTRSQGKVAVLALGYNGGVNSLRVMGADGSDAELKRLVYGWRDANPAIVGLWKTLGSVFRLGGEAGPYLRVERDGKSRHLILPSGRSISYHKCVFRQEMGDYGPRWDMSFASSTSPGRRDRTYGGRLTENATQAVARDLLAHALVNLERAGYQTVGHIHDEVLVEIPSGTTMDVDDVSRVICTTPSWAKGLPVDGEGFISNRYKKG